MPLLQDDFLEKIEIAKSNRAALPPRIRTMHSLYGSTPGKQCRECIHLVTKEYANNYFKCNLTKDTGGPASDWRKSWPACGKFEEIKKLEDT
jgi:hypothetical protein